MKASNLTEALWSAMKNPGVVVEFPEATEQDQDVLWWLSDDSEELFDDLRNAMQITVSAPLGEGDPCRWMIRYWIPQSHAA